MNGDYFYFVEEEYGGLSIVIVDVIGKGILVVMCMFMIKYVMDSLLDLRKNLSYVLENLNNIVEWNVDLSMFIMMFYGSYNFEINLFDYVFVGYELGFYYDVKVDLFEDLEVKGFVLGVDCYVKYF